MSVTKEGLESFRAIYASEFDEVLDDEELERKARFLMNLFTAIYRSPVEIIKSDELIENSP